MPVSGKGSSITVLSWNCLADCYAQGAAASRLKERNVMQWSFRWSLITRIIRKADADIVCLQEVDHYEESYRPFFEYLNYTPVYCQRKGREDGVLIAVKIGRIEILQKHTVQFDDLAFVSQREFSPAQRHRFKKQNVALLLLARTHGPLSEANANRDSFTICTTHLYWNPSFPQVKLAQARYLLERITYVRDHNDLAPAVSILTGDFNSLPNSDTYVCIEKGMAFPNLSGRCLAGAVQRVFSAFPTQRGSVRFLCDGTLGKLARWLRVLGVDAALEDKDCEERRSRFNDCSALFQRACEENRVIVTSSTNLLKRAACPETFLVATSRPARLENGLASLLNRYNIELNRKNFLTRCGSCGGSISTCDSDDRRVTCQDKEFPDDRQLYICEECEQIYWWSSSVNGSSARAHRLANRLYSMVQKSQGEPVKKRNKCTSQISNDRLKDCWCKWNVDDDSCLSSSSHKGKQNWLRYVSSEVKAHDKEPEYTNINGSFRGTLDYIFVAGSCEVINSTVMEDVDGDRKGVESSFPNESWPSDHMVLQAEILLKKPPIGRPGLARTLSSPM